MRRCRGADAIVADQATSWQGCAAGLCSSHRLRARRLVWAAAGVRDLACTIPCGELEAAERTSLSATNQRYGMNTGASNDPRIQDVRVSPDEIIARLADGRVISVPLAWSWRLSEATPKQRENVRLTGPVKVCTGLMSTRTSASKECFTASRHIARGRDRATPMPGVTAVTNRRTIASSRRAGSVAPKSGAAARAADTQRYEYRRDPSRTQPAHDVVNRHNP